MAIKQLNPYLFFDGNAAEAIATYERVLGAKNRGVMRFGDAPGQDVPAAIKARVMHATLELAGSLLMISDTTPDRPIGRDGNVQVLLEFDDVADLKAKFDALAEGGRVVSAVHDAFWGATFGTLVDAFGIQWMFHSARGGR